MVRVPKLASVMAMYRSKALVGRPEVSLSDLHLPATLPGALKFGNGPVSAAHIAISARLPKLTKTSLYYYGAKFGETNNLNERDQDGGYG